MRLVNITNGESTVKLKSESTEKLAEWLLKSDLIKKELWRYIDPNNKLLPDTITKALNGGKAMIICGDYILKVTNGICFDVYIKFDSIKRKIPVFTQFVGIEFIDLETVEVI